MVRLLLFNLLTMNSIALLQLLSTTSCILAQLAVYIGPFIGLYSLS